MGSTPEAALPEGQLEVAKHVLSYIRPPFTGQLLRPDSPWYLWVLGVIGDFIIVGGVVFLLLQAIPTRLRKAFIMVVTFLCGLIFSVEFFVPSRHGTDTNFLSHFTEQVVVVTTVIQAFAVGVGAYSLFRFHGKILARLRAGWHNSLAFFIAFAALLLAGFYRDSAESTRAANLFTMLFQSSIVPLGATMFATVGFFIVTAAYRAFRVRSSEATLMLTAALIVMLGQVPVGAYLTQGLPQEGFWAFFRLENLSYWILRGPNMAAQRGMAFGIEVGALAMSLRLWLSLERGSFFEQEL